MAAARLALQKPLPFRGGVGGRACPADAAFAARPHLAATRQSFDKLRTAKSRYPSPKEEGLRC